MNDHFDKSAHIERTLKLCALEVHHSGELQRLAWKMGVSPKVFRYWWTKGRVPKTKAAWLEASFPHIVTAANLIG